MNKIYNEIESYHANWTDILGCSIWFLPMIIFNFPGFSCTDNSKWEFWVGMTMLAIIGIILTVAIQMYREIILKLTQRCDELLDEINELKNKN